MKRIIIICEGTTEIEFCKKTLEPHFRTFNKSIQAPLISKTKGGITKWKFIKKDIHKLLNGDSTAFITTFFDFYGINSTHEFPGWDKANYKLDKYEKLEYLENEMYKIFDSNKFIPNLILHEFESLLFTDMHKIIETFNITNQTKRRSLEKIFLEFPNPELINDNKNTAPSKRLIDIVNGYNKIVFGNILAESIGLETIRRKCKKFNEWVVKLESI